MLICMNTFSTIKSKQQAENYFSEELRQYFDGSNIKGRLMERLGLTKNIPSEKIFTAILNNKHPVTGKKLRPRESKRLLFSSAFQHRNLFQYSPCLQTIRDCLMLTGRPAI